MGQRMETFKCPHCGAGMTRNVGPNWTPIQSPAPSGQTTFVFSCIQCQKALGVTTTGLPEQR